MDQEQPTNAQIMEMLRGQEARADEQQRRVAELEQRAAMVDRLAAENLELRANAQRVESELKAENVELKAELERQRLAKVSLTSRVNEVESGPDPQDRKLSRAGLFKAAAMGSAAVVGAGALGTLGAENAAAATSDTNFTATGTVTNFDARGTSNYGLDTSFGAFSAGANLVGSSYGATAVGLSSSSIALFARGGQYGAELTSDSGSPLYLVPTSSTGSPTTGTFNPGAICVDSIGRMYHCVAYGTPGTWVPLNALIPISPVRVLDTRGATRVGLLTGPYATGTTLDIAIAGQTFSAGSTTFTFPSTTIGVVGNLVAVTPTGAGYLVAYPQGAALPSAASVNFVPPGTGADVYYALGNHVTVALSATGHLNIYAGLVPGANVQIVLDIAGYLV